MQNLWLGRTAGASLQELCIGLGAALGFGLGAAFASYGASASLHLCISASLHLCIFASLHLRCIPRARLHLDGFAFASEQVMEWSQHGTLAHGQDRIRTYEM